VIERSKERGIKSVFWVWILLFSK